MWDRKCVALALVVGSAFCPLLAGQQPPHCAQITFCLFNQEAEASDPAGIHKYSEDLIGLIVPPEAGKADVEPLADRLARAEKMARTGKGKLVAETDVVRAFNELMAKVGAPSSLRTDEASMRRFREHGASIKAFPALLSADRNGTNCNPGEAVFLLHLLMSDDGVLYDRNLDSAQALMQMDSQRNRGGQDHGITGMGHGVAHIGAVQTAQWLLSSYSRNHDLSATNALFNNLADTLGF